MESIHDEDETENIEDLTEEQEKRNEKERLEDFNSHVKATQKVVKERIEELINSNEIDPKKRRLTFKDVSAKVTSKLKEDKQPRMVAFVENAMARMTSKEDDQDRNESISNPAIVNYSPATIANAWCAKVRAKRQLSMDPNNVVAVPMDKLQELKKRVSQVST